MAAVRHYQKHGGLRQQNLVRSPFWKPEVCNQFHWSVGENPFLSISSFWWLPALGLWLGIEPETLQCTGRSSKQPSHTSQGPLHFYFGKMGMFSNASKVMNASDTQGDSPAFLSLKQNNCVHVMPKQRNKFQRALRGENRSASWGDSLSHSNRF